MAPTEMFPPFLARCPENSGCSIHAVWWQSMFTTCPWLGHEPPLCFSCLIIQMKSLVQNIPQALAALISRAVMLHHVSSYKSTKASSSMQEFPSTQRGLAKHERHSLLAWAAGAQLSFRSGLAWPLARGKDWHWFLSWKNMHHDTCVAGIAIQSCWEEEILVFRWGSQLRVSP